MNASTKNTMLTGLLSLCLFSPATAAEFSGNLKGVSITDAQATNKAPVATFTYTQNGDIVAFDASGSSDTDGSISKYKWDFGNGTIAEGVTTNYTSLDAATLKVTLTVVDNNNGVAINQQEITPATNSIFDAFSNGTSANYISIIGTVLISDGVAMCPEWTRASVYHKESTGNSDNYAQIGIVLENQYNHGGVIARWNPTVNTGYIAMLYGTSIQLYSRSGDTDTLLKSYSKNYQVGVNYNVKITSKGSLISVYVDDVEVISVNDNKHKSGEYVGFSVSRGYGSKTTLDNFAGGSL